jgi:2-hydroxyglutarate dehydrogenase
MSRHFVYGLKEMFHDIFSRRYALPSVQQYIPAIEWADIDHKFSGVRAQCIDDDGKLIEDFVFQQQGSSILHIRNAPSPAATSSLAIAKRVADKAEEVFKFK